MSTVGAARGACDGMQVLQQALDESALAWNDFFQGFFWREPLGAIDLRKGRFPTAPWRPLQLERVGYHFPDVEITLDRPGRDHFPARLIRFSQRAEVAARLAAEFLGKLSLGDSKRVL